MNGDAFRVYIEKVLAPTLSRGDIVVIDNLASHKVAGVREAIEAVDAKLLPAAILPRSKSYRTGLRQVQDGSAKGRRTNRR